MSQAHVDHGSGRNIRVWYCVTATWKAPSVRECVAPIAARISWIAARSLG